MFWGDRADDEEMGNPVLVGLSQFIKILLFRKEVTSGTTLGEKEEGEESREEVVDDGDGTGSDLMLNRTSWISLIWC